MVPCTLPGIIPDGKARVTPEHHHVWPQNKTTNKASANVWLHFNFYCFIWFSVVLFFCFLPYFWLKYILSFVLSWGHSYSWQCPGLTPGNSWGTICSVMIQTGVSCMPDSALTSVLFVWTSLLFILFSFHLVYKNSNKKHRIASHLTSYVDILSIFKIGVIPGNAWWCGVKGSSGLHLAVCMGSCSSGNQTQDLTHSHMLEICSTTWVISPALYLGILYLISLCQSSRDAK